jgi:hypothetical protein
VGNYFRYNKNTPEQFSLQPIPLAADEEEDCFQSSLDHDCSLILEPLPAWQCLVFLSRSDHCGFPTNLQEVSHERN